MIRPVGFIDEMDAYLLGNVDDTVSIREVQPAVAKLSPDKLRYYVFHYINIDEFIERKRDTLCEDCPCVSFAEDINDTTCLVDFDIESSMCCRHAMVSGYLRNLISVDIYLRSRLGDMF